MKKILIVTIIAFILIGCQRVSKQEAVTLTINFPSSDLFYSRVGFAFEQKFPHIKIEVIEQKSGEQTVPNTDIIFMNNVRGYKDLLETNTLSPITGYIKQEEELFSSVSHVVTDSLTTESGDLFGLSPSFISSGLYYNKNLFEKYKIPFPHNQMSWSEIYELAMQFPNYDEEQNRLYGFTSNYYKEVPINLILRMGETEGRNYVDPQTHDIHINSAEWRNIGRVVLDAISKQTVFNESEEMLGEYGEAPVIRGQSAMQIASYSTAINFTLYEQQHGSEAARNWGVVTVPVDPLNPEYSDYYSLSEIYGINTKASNREAAWEFIKFIVTDKQYYEFNMENLSQFGIPANQSFMPKFTDKDLSPLYSLKPQQVSNNPYEKVNREIINAFKTAAQSVLDDYLDGGLTIEETFVTIEQEGQAAVDVTKQKLGLD
ncbi:ABC transporter substrate-binding protein [Paenibacillus harenae]|uniref:ABC-type glycerol-3-phosphate transport system substrate-binding protein n=1 Tax=Paenibacillus harenae TaxID=306543 RepID=A0ABT9U1H5_PAEHA|nr:ABC transporter substrate-binding protein [Paenibacillus harenae]MDQ0113482.1 ABC-type glycerol-3-phosphate transport system substrate-binding protein [Paenibacillus harenae]